MTEVWRFSDAQWSLLITSSSLFGIQILLRLTSVLWLTAYKKLQPELLFLRFVSIKVTPELSLIVTKVRAFGETALKTLDKSGASSSGPPPTHRDVDAEVTATFNILQKFLPETLVTASLSPNTPRQPRYTILEISLKFQASLVADLVFARTFDDAQAWHRCVGQYMSVWLGGEQAATFTDSLRMHYLAIDQVRGYFYRIIFPFFSTALLYSRHML